MKHDVDVGFIRVSFDLRKESSEKCQAKNKPKICYEVEGINEIPEGLKKQDVKLVDEKLRPGSRNRQIAFVEAASAGGVCTEYCEFCH